MKQCFGIKLSACVAVCYWHWNLPSTSTISTKVEVFKNQPTVFERLKWFLHITRLYNCLNPTGSTS